ncbi:CHAT domain-containing protein [Kitasatospora purpeofusca]|uniref:CHAT domain-containing protein n=1 Tax=Kitasatospora purpeofusca TaxID=67352 RepID=UPI0036D28DAF
MAPALKVRWNYQRAVSILRNPRAAADPRALRRAVGLLEQARAAVPAGDPLLTQILHALAGAHHGMFRLTKDSAELDRAVVHGEEAVARALDADDAVPARGGLAVILASRFEWTRDVADIRRAADVLEPATARETADPFERATLLATLGQIQMLLFRETSQGADIDRAVGALETAAALAPRHPVAGRFLTSLANALALRFEAGGHPGGLDEAVDRGRRAVAHLDRPEARDLPAMEASGYRSNLASILAQRFDAAGDPADLQESVDLLRAAADSVRDPLDAAGLHGNLALALTIRHQHLGSLEDLDEAVERARRSVATGPTADITFPRRASTLAGALALRHSSTGSPADLDEAITAFRLAAAPAQEAGAAADPDLPLWLSNLSTALIVRFEAAGAQQDLLEAVAASRRASAAEVPELRRAPVESQLAATLTRLAQHAGSAADADAAVEAALRAVASGQQGARQSPRPGYAIWLHRLGDAHRARHRLTGRTQDLTAAVDAYTRASDVRTAPFTVRARSAREAGLAIGERDWRAAADAWEKATGLLAAVADRRISRASRQRQLVRFDGLALDAAAAALNVGDPARALAALEQGRGVLLTQALESRSDLGELDRLSPELASEFRRLAMLVEADTAGALPLGLDAEPSGPGAERRRAERADAWDALVSRIRRTVPGMSRFLLPPPVSELTAAADQGPLVVVNVSTYRCDALLVTPDGVRAVPLPGLDAQTVGAYARALEARTAPGADPEEFLTELLAWLWTAVAAPVLEHAEPLLGAARRLWWIPTGLLALLPLHAAGLPPDDAGQRPPGVPELVTASYAPTVRMLRPPPPNAPDPAPGTLVVAVGPDGTRRGVRLALDEAAAVKRASTGGTALLADGQATVARVREALSGAGRAHFACHGVTDAGDPSSSHLVLHGGTLEVRDIAVLRPPGAGLAFLSACSTAASGEILSNEAIHLSSAFHLAGYAHVIGTLWPVADSACLELTEQVYAALADHSPAEALRQAVTALRAEYLDSPSVWAAHLHLGR